MKIYMAHQFRTRLTYLPLAYILAYQFDRINEDCRVALLAMASETPANRTEVNSIEVGTVTTKLLFGKKGYHFRLKISGCQASCMNSAIGHCLRQFEKRTQKWMKPNGILPVTLYT